MYNQHRIMFHRIFSLDFISEGFIHTIFFSLFLVIVTVCILYSNWPAEEHISQPVFALFFQHISHPKLNK